RAPPLLFRRRPPQSNYPPATVRAAVNGCVRSSTKQGWYFTGGSARAETLASTPPPMLRRSCRRSMAGCSKGARGLFVLMREIGILTDTAVSPSLRRRQPSSRYAIHAGRNLPDKEFRYLRTVIVTAAVYRGFGSQLRLAANRLR